MEEVVPNYLYHLWGDTDDEFFKRIDQFGGWPLGKTWVGFDHGVVRHRPCNFYDQEVRTGWVTTIHCADDYYWWKVSEARKLEYKQKVTREVAAVIRDLQWKKS